MEFDVFNWVVLPILTFLARVLDVSVGTVRIIVLSKGRKFLAPILGFVEIIIWLFAVRQIFLNLANPFCYIAFAGGFAVGNYVGIILEEKLAIGVVVIRIITRKDAQELFHSLNAQGYGVTNVPAQGAMGNVNVIFTIVHRSEINKVISIIKEFNPKTFYTIEDIRSISGDLLFIRNSVFKNRFLK